jgi:predicted alpha/beta superfamily hydrolase
MKPRHLLTAACLFLLGTDLLRAETGPAAPAFPPHVVPGTELRVLPRTRPDRLYQLHIALPASFRDHPEKKYPVVFVTDGYWDFTTVVATYGNMVYGKSVPEMLIVGLGYAGENLDYEMLRSDDLSPMVVHGLFDGGGQAQQFLQMIETAAIPLLEKEYRADPAHRYLMGCSSGGLFTLYTMLTKPELFQGYVADSPSVDGVWNFEREFAASGRTTTARVFISAAENEWKYYRQQVGVFYRRLEAHGTVKGGLHFQRIDQVRHAGGKPQCYTQGLLFVTAPIAPETGVATDWMFDPQNRPGFVINFWPSARTASTTPTPAQVEALRAHDTFLARLLAEKHAEYSTSTPPEVKQRYSTLMLFAADRAAADALARTDPAVMAGVLAYEVIQAED